MKNDESSATALFIRLGVHYPMLSPVIGRGMDKLCCEQSGCNERWRFTIGTKKPLLVDEPRYFLASAINQQGFLFLVVDGLNLKYETDPAATTALVSERQSANTIL